jgi:hypothetical protein
MVGGFEAIAGLFGLDAGLFFDLGLGGGEGGEWDFSASQAKGGNRRRNSGFLRFAAE